MGGWWNLSALSLRISEWRGRRSLSLSTDLGQGRLLSLPLKCLLETVTDEASHIFVLPLSVRHRSRSHSIVEIFLPAILTRRSTSMMMWQFLRGVWGRWQTFLGRLLAMRLWQRHGEAWIPGIAGWRDSLELVSFVLGGSGMASASGVATASIGLADLDGESSLPSQVTTNSYSVDLAGLSEWSSVVA